jgi:2-(1,2-epoxy-1,2-dihydrophenyl)acetyl-CoA isomerase
VVDDGKARSRAIELIQIIQRNSLSSFAASKSLLTDSFHTPFETQMEKERDLLAWAADQPSGREGVAAFLEKRKPAFKPNATIPISAGE